jgi:hypothetical protein
MTRRGTQWGLNSTDQHWSTRGPCKKLPDAWSDLVYVRRVLAAHNVAAVRMCRGACPVRDRCLEKAMSLHPADRADQILGGLVFDSNGQPIASDHVDEWLNNPELPTAAQARPRQQRRPKTNLQPCGTPAAYQRHRNRGEDPCPPCKDAMRNNRARAAANKVMGHGTASAIRQHIAHGELLCDTCSAVADELAGAVT